MIALLLFFGGWIGADRMYADTVTDTLSVKVGYLGMDLSEYVEAGKEGGYSWVELSEELPIQELSYSYFQSKYSNYRKYTAIVDTARGFYIRDLLDFVKVNYGDVRSLKFYVEDHKGIQAAFDRDALFGTRYYFDDLSGHRRAIYDEHNDTKLIGFDFEEAAQYGYQVDPILALEDNWAQFNEEIEHIGPDNTYMSTSTRFRLLFGQTTPTESMTSSSAKYVSCVYVTLQGKPEVGEMPQMDGSIGSHTVELDVKADDEAIRNALDSLMNVSSSNEQVLQVTGVEVTPDAVYSDLARIRISYDILGEGEASLSVGVGHGDGHGDTVKTGYVVGKATGSQSADISKGSSDPSDQEAAKEDTTEPTKKKSAEGTSGSGTGQADRKADAKEQSGSNDGSQGAKRPAHTVKDAQRTSANVAAYELSADAVRRLALAMEASTAEAPDQQVRQLKVEDKSEEKKGGQRMTAAMTGLACLGLSFGGAAAENLSFRFRLRRRDRG